MESVVKILLGLLSTQLGISEDAAAELLYQPSEDGEGLDRTKIKDNALELLLEQDVARVSKLKSTGVDKTEIFNDAYDKAKKEVLGKAEKALAKKYGIDQGTLKLPELVQTIVSEQVKVAAATGDGITEDLVKKHPTFLSLERAKIEEIENLQQQHETEVQKLQDSYARTETVNTVKADVLSYFDGLKPVLSEDQVKASNQRKRFAKTYEQFNYQKDGDNWLMLDTDGKRMEDSHGNPITLKSHVAKEAANFYDFKVQDDKGSPGNSGGGIDGKTVVVPTNEADYIQAIFNAGSADEREAIETAYHAE